MAENNGPKFNFIFLPPTPWLLMSKVYSSVCLSQSTIEPQNRCVRYFWDIFQPLGCAHWVFGIKYWCQLITRLNMLFIPTLPAKAIYSKKC